SSWPRLYSVLMLDHVCHVLVAFLSYCCLLFFNDTAPTEIYTLSLHDALPIWPSPQPARGARAGRAGRSAGNSRAPDRRERHGQRSEEHTSELQSPDHLVCRLLLEKKKKFQKAAK